MRLIDADALRKRIKAKNASNAMMKAMRKECVAEIDDAPTIEPKKGRWIEYDNSHCECPFCHEEWSYFDNEVEHFNYCPNCGADMREGEADADDDA